MAENTANYQWGRQSSQICVNAPAHYHLVVIAGLAPAIHAVAFQSRKRTEKSRSSGMDAMDVPWHDAMCWCSYRLAALNVSQALRSPDWKPFLNQLARCAEVPWLKLSGTT